MGLVAKILEWGRFEWTIIKPDLVSFLISSSTTLGSANAGGGPSTACIGWMEEGGEALWALLTWADKVEAVGEG